MSNSETRWRESDREPAERRRPGALVAAGDLCDSGTDRRPVQSHPHTPSARVLVIYDELRHVLLPNAKPGGGH